MTVTKTSFWITLVTGVLWSGSTLSAASSAKLTGAIEGYVKDVTGVPQMGATVQLFNRYERMVGRVLTDEKGAFAFPSLGPDVYGLRVSLASFVPALKQNISVQPGMRSILAINLASVLSSIELVYSGPTQGIMSDDWKWVLRGSMATRPILRMLPEVVDVSDPNRPGVKSAAAMFSDTRGLFRVSSGESGPYQSFANQPDLGTEFALATSLYGNTHVQFAGNLGYSSNIGAAATAFRTTVSRNEGVLTGPELNVTLRQLTLPGRFSGGLMGGPQDGVPVMRSMSIGLVERAQIMDGVRLDYGASLESVQFVDHLNYASPFARLSFDLGAKGEIALGYSSGAPAAELLSVDSSSDTSLQHDLSALSVYPRVSLLDGRAKVQRSENFEIGYHKVAGSRTYSVGVFRETVSNTALTLSAPDGILPATDLLPDISSPSSVFNMGGFQRMGMVASVTQRLHENFDVSLGYGNGGALHTSTNQLVTNSPDELRSIIRSSQRQWVLGQITATAPVLGTKVIGSYQWTDKDSLLPGHVYLTQSVQAPVGLNVWLRQPIHSFALISGRLEATAELRNMLAQGYLPINSAEGARIRLIQAPRAVRGGLSFIF